MENGPHYDVAFWQTHETEDDCNFVIRTSNGRVFYCDISPSQLRRSPRVTERYFKCLNVLRSGEEMDDFYVEDACDWLSKPFEPLISQLAPSALPGHGRPTLSQYLFPPYFVCTLTATDEQLQPCRLDTQDHGWSSPIVRVDNDFLRDLQWTRSYLPSDVEICYDDPRDVLIKPPTRVTVDDGGPVACFFKPFEISHGRRHAIGELIAHKKIATANVAQARVCRLHGVVRDGSDLAGMLFTWIDNKGVLSQGRAEQSPVQLRRRWASQISGSLEKLHQRGIVWGDAKAENILIDKDDDACIIDFGGSYTLGWVDKDKAGTLDGDMQGLAKIMDMLE